MRLIFSEQAWSDYEFWQEHDPAVSQRIRVLTKEVGRVPFSGMGKPEPLVGDMKGFWSRRVTREHRLVYRVAGKGGEQTLEIAACRYHYRK